MAAWDARAVGRHAGDADLNADMAIAPGHRRPGVLLDFLDRTPLDVGVQGSGEAALATEQLINWHAEMFARHVPQGDVDCAQSAHDRRATEVALAIQVLPVMFDPQRVLADEVVREFGNHLLGRFQEAPRPSFAEPDDAGVGVHLHEQVAIDRLGFDTGDLHGTYKGM